MILIPDARLHRSAVTMIPLLIITSFDLLVGVYSCSCNMPSLREVLCRSKYSAIIRVNSNQPAATLVTRSASLRTSLPNHKSRLVASRRSSTEREEEGETIIKPAGNLNPHRITVLHMISRSPEGEKALKSQIIWSRISKSSCSPVIRPGFRYLIFGDVSPDGRALVNTCNLMQWETLTQLEREELRSYAERGLPCRWFGITLCIKSSHADSTCVRTFSLITIPLTLNKRRHELMLEKVYFGITWLLTHLSRTNGSGFLFLTGVWTQTCVHLHYVDLLWGDHEFWEEMTRVSEEHMQCTCVCVGDTSLNFLWIYRTTWENLSNFWRQDSERDGRREKDRKSDSMVFEQEEISVERISWILWWLSSTASLIHLHLHS